MAGHLKFCLTVILGYLMFHDPITMLQLAGIFLTLSGMFVCLIVFNATFNNISVISWRSVLLVEEPEGPRENHQPATSQ